jgi:multidrug transporter EmrE-like cation transporter
MQTRYFLFLHGSYFLYSTTGIFSKLASRHEFFSFPFCIFYGFGLFIIFIYAILWQQILKRISLITASSNKGIIVIWSIVWGRLFFKENIQLNMIIGILFIMLGIYILARFNNAKSNI